MMIELEFKTREELDKWLEIWAPLAKFVAENEPNTLAYEAAVADNGPLKILVIER